MKRAASLFVVGSFVVACSAKVARLPRPGESLASSTFTVEAGGKGFNLALGAHRLGARVDGLFAVGNDLFSQLAAHAFEQAGLSPCMLRFLETATGSGIGFTDAQGENCLAVYPGANALLSSGEIRSVAECVRQTDLVLAQFEVSDEPILEAFALAQEAGRQTLLNPSPYRSVDPGILQKTSILVLNSTEAEQMSHDLDLNMGKISAGSLDALACVLLTRGPELVIVTLGGNGAAAYPRGKTPFHQAAFPVEVVDTLGAGDAFTAGLAASFLENRSLKESLERAAACGAIVCQRVGVFDALPTANELELFLYAAGSQPQV